MTEQIDPQETFDIVAAHLLKQGCQSLDQNGDCMYRAPDGCKCAVGVLIRDEDYDPDIEYKDSNDLAHEHPHLGLIAHDLSLLYALQLIHDSKEVKDWPAALRKVARRFGLSTTVIDEWEAGR